MQCPECNFPLSGTEEVCPRCLTPLNQEAGQGAAQPAPGASAPAIDLSALQRGIERDSKARPREMTAEMRRLMEGPVWTTRRTQLALTVFLLVAAVVVIAVVMNSVMRRNAEYYLEQGQEYYQLGQYEMALVGYLRAIELDADLAAAENGAGWCYLKLGQFSMAVPHLNRAVSLDAELGEAHRGLGIAYSQAHMNVEAEASLKGALKVNANDLVATRYLGKVYYQEQRYEEAVELLEGLTGRRGDDVVALEYLGRSLYAMEQYPRAKDALEAAVALDPSVEAVREYLGLTWYQLGRYDKALDHFRFLQSAHPDEPVWYAYIGRSLYKDGDYEAAAAHLVHALTLAHVDPVLGGSHLYMGWTRYEQQRYDEAIIWFQRALLMDPLDPEAMGGLGTVYVDIGRCDLAVPLFRNALTIDRYLESAKQGLAACQ